MIDHTKEVVVGIDDQHGVNLVVVHNALYIGNLGRWFNRLGTSRHDVVHCYKG